MNNLERLGRHAEVLMRQIEVNSKKIRQQKLKENTWDTRRLKATLRILHELKHLADDQRTLGIPRPLSRLLEPEKIKRFYENWEEEPVHWEWPYTWRKEFRAELPSGGFVSLNRLKSRL